MFLRLALFNKYFNFIKIIKTMKRVLLYVLVIFLLAFTTHDSLKNTTILINPESQLAIKGKTNVNKFQCIYNTSNLQNPIAVYYEIRDNSLIFEDTKLILKTDCFDCGNKTMNKDFKNLLESETYPQIQIILKELKRPKTQNTKIMQAQLDIEITGMIKKYTIPVSLENKKQMFVKGTLLLNITDFNIEPPKKLLGIITVEKTIEIDLNLRIEEY